MKGTFLLYACLLALVFIATLTEAKPVAKKHEKATKNLEATTKGEDKNDDENENEDKSEEESKGKNQSGSGLNDGKEIVKWKISSFLHLVTSPVGAEHTTERGSNLSLSLKIPHPAQERLVTPPCRVYVPHSFRTVLWVLLRPTRTR